jgi:hypothetical protein
MERTITVSNTDIPLSLQKATVIHANKYSQAHGGWSNLPVSSTLYTEVAFRIDETNKDLRTTIKDRDLPVYNGQEVTIISVGKAVLGFVDMQTNYYYYTTGDFSRKLGMGPAFYWVWIIGLLGGITVYLLDLQQGMFLWLLVPLGIALLLYYVQKWILNMRIRKAMDKVLQ